MIRNLFLMAAALACQFAGIDAIATNACTAANPNGNITESTPASAFINNGDGTVTHTLTGLMWARCPVLFFGAQCDTNLGFNPQQDWPLALGNSVNFSLAGHHDWRVPNIRELQSIVEFCGSGPAINQATFPSTPGVAFWSSTTDQTTPANALYIYFFSGNTGTAAKTSSFLVRLVRGGRSFSAFDAQHPLLSTLDIDGNGTADALTDGLLILRYLFGLRGSSLINGAVAPGAPRATAPGIEAYLQSLVPKQ